MATVVASPLRAIAWRRPDGYSWPRLIEGAIARLRTAADRKTGPLFDHLARRSPLLEGGERERSRRMRSDGLENLVTLLSTIVCAADLGTGFLGSPRVGGGQWERRSWADIDAYAFGRRVECERSMRRTERHLRLLKRLGFVELHELRRKTSHGAYESAPAVKHLTDAFWRLVGLYEQLAAARRRRDRERGQQRAEQLAKIVQPRKAATGLPKQGASLPAAVVDRSAPAGARDAGERPPGPTPAALAAIEALRAKLGG
jgi:hypothetical protein